MILYKWNTKQRFFTFSSDSCAVKLGVISLLQIEILKIVPYWSCPCLSVSQ